MRKFAPKRGEPFKPFMAIVDLRERVREDFEELDDGEEVDMEVGKEVERLRRQLDDRNTEIKGLVKKNKEMQESAGGSEKLQKIIANRDSIIAEKEKKLKLQAASISQLHDSIAKLKKKHADESPENNEVVKNLKKEIKKLSKEVNSLTSELENANSDKAKLSEKASKHFEKSESLIVQKQDLEKNCHVLTSKIEQLKKIIVSLKTNNEEKDKTIAFLGKQETKKGEGEERRTEGRVGRREEKRKEEEEEQTYNRYWGETQ